MMVMVNKCWAKGSACAALGLQAEALLATIKGILLNLQERVIIGLQNFAIKCDVCGLRVEKDSCLNEHKKNEHAILQNRDEEMDIDTPGVNIKDISSDLDLNTDGNVDKRVKELEIEIQKMVVKHETKVDDLTAKLEDKQNEYDGLKIKMDQLVKENGKRSDEIKKLKEEN